MNNLNRREFIQRSTAAGVSLSLPVMASGPVSAADITSDKLMPTRTIPSSGESLGVIGYSSARTFTKNSIEDNATHKTLFKILIETGGNYIDADSVSEKNIAGWLNEIGSLNNIFMGSSLGIGYKITGPAVEEMQQSLSIRGKETLDLVQVRHLVDMENRWPVMREWKDAGKVHHLGVTSGHYSEYEKLEAIMKKYQPDFISVNYSVLEPEAEERILPLASDLGIAVISTRPFLILPSLSLMNYGNPQKGLYFGNVNNYSVPEWAADFDCESWAQFSLKYILANSNVTCVLTETKSPVEVRDHLQAAFGRLPDDTQLKRMREHIKFL